MKSKRRPARPELPQAPLELAYPLAVTDGAVLGAVLLHEVPEPFALHVFTALRMVCAWAAGPEASGAVFDAADGEEWEVAVLRTEGVDADLWAPVALIAGELAHPAEADAERLAHACLAVTDWAVSHDAQGTALQFAEAAAAVWPANARIAWLAGRLYRDRRQFARAELWLRRARRIAVWNGDWDLQALSVTSLGNLKLMTGQLPGARELLTSALRLARRRGLREREAKALHDLFVCATYAGRLDEAETYAAQAFAAYGAEHADLINLAFDVSHFWTQQGQFARALGVLRALDGRFPDADRQARVAASTARAAGALGDAACFHAAWQRGWQLLDTGVVEHLRAAAPLELGMGALSLGLWEYAEHALAQARDAAAEMREGDTLARAEAALESLRADQAAGAAAGARTFPPPARNDLADRLIRSLRARPWTPADPDAHGLAHAPLVSSPSRS